MYLLKKNMNLCNVFTKFLDGTENESFYTLEHKNEIKFFSHFIIKFNLEPRS